jgi:hypothetical protein
MVPFSNWANSVRSGPRWLLRRWQRDVITRHVVLGLIAHVSLLPLLCAAFRFLGAPTVTARFLGLITDLILVAQAAEKGGGG